MGFVFAGKSPTIFGIRWHFHEVVPCRPELSIANKERDKISKKAKAKMEAGVHNSAEFGGRGNTSGEIVFINFTTLQKILKIIYQYISRCVISQMSKTNVMINVKRYFRINQNIQSQSFQTVPRWTDAGYFNEGFAARLYCGNISRLGIGIEQSTIARLVDYRPENADYRLSTFEVFFKKSTIDF